MSILSLPINEEILTSSIINPMLLEIYCFPIQNLTLKIVQNFMVSQASGLCIDRLFTYFQLLPCSTF